MSGLQDYEETYALVFAQKSFLLISVITGEIVLVSQFQ